MSETEQSNLIREFFGAALEFEPDDRFRFLRQQCGADSALLAEVWEHLTAYEEAPDFLDKPLFDFVAFKREVERVASPDHNRDVGDRKTTGESLPGGTQVGKYTILRKIGEGGTGTVYEAWQNDVPRRVALKMLRASKPDQQRARLFWAEIETLAGLDHLGIARIYEAGTTTDGRPFFTMALLNGGQLDAYLEREGPSRSRRLDLFLDICEAVGFAHEKGVIHRDLKPSNILVDGEGKPKVIDFSIALLADRDLRGTRRGSDERGIVGTLAYMSPEQAGGIIGELDKRSDVYVLGVILFELLTGEPPYDLSGRSWDEALEIIRKEPPRDPGATDPTLRGDLAFIVRKALAKDPSERYQEAAHLSHAIDCYLTDRPVPDRPASAVYHLRKLVARHKVPSALVATLFVSVLVFGICMTFLYAEADRLRNKAERQTKTAMQALQLLEHFSRRAPNLYFPETFGNWSPVQLDAVADFIEPALTEYPNTEAALRDALGLTYASLGLYNSAEHHLRKALSIRQELLAHEPLEVDKRLEVAESLEHVSYYLSFYRWWGNPHRNPDEYQEALDNCRAALAIYREVLGEYHNVTLRAMCELAHLHQMAGDLSTRWEIACQVVIAGRNSLLGKSIAPTLMLQGPAIIAEAGAAGGFEEDLREFIFAAITAISEDPLKPETVRGLLDRGVDLIREMWTSGQQELARRFIRLFYEPFVSDSFWSNAIPSVMTVFAEGQMLDSDFDTAEPILREAVRAGRKQFGDSTLLVAWSLEDLALVVGQQDPAEAEELMQEVLTIRRRTQGDSYPQVAVTLERLAVLLMQQGKFAEAEPLLRECLDVRREALLDEPWLAALAESLLGECLTALGRYTEAEELLLNSSSLLRARWGPQYEQTSAALERIIGLYEVSGQPEKAAHYRALGGSEE